ncbi:F-box/WD-40 repeat-containing protein [Hordeum vulgare]|nr:F-box/WD-40 repeat-containing protein [Hordeum vulgare]
MQFFNAKLPAAVVPATVLPSTWLAPLNGNAKVNVDDVVSRHGFGAVGVICRDHNDMFMRVSTLAFRDIVDPATLEALAIREALALADDLYLRRIQVASDCKVVVQELTKDNSGTYGAGGAGRATADGWACSRRLGRPAARRGGAGRGGPAAGRVAADGWACGAARRQGAAGRGGAAGGRARWGGAADDWACGAAGGRAGRGGPWQGAATGTVRREGDGRDGGLVGGSGAGWMR